MIVTLTPNPSLDRTIAVDELTTGAVHRARALRVDAGGKGVNVSRALAANGRPTVAVVPAAGPEGDHFVALLHDEGVTVDPVPLEDAIRSNITLVERGGRTTKVNEQGRRSGPEDAAAMLDAVDARLGGATWVVGAGSLPPGLGDAFYRDLVVLGRRRGVRTAIDTSGPPLREAVAAGPDLVKPNLDEFTELVGRPLDTLADVVDAAQHLVQRGVGTVVVSLGVHGAVAVSAKGVEHAFGRVVSVRSNVGAGDCLLAGWLAARAHGAQPAEALRAGVIWGSAAVGLAGSRVPGPHDLELPMVEVSETPPLELRLTGDVDASGRPLP